MHPSRVVRPFFAFFALAFGIAWGGILFVTRKTGLPDPGGTATALRPWVFLAMIAGPSLASFGLTAFLDGTAGLRDLAVRLARWRGPFAALLVGPGAMLLALAVLAPFSPAFAPGLSSAGYALAAGLFAGFFEELGWTGFATPRMLERHGVVRTGLVLGVLWALWHALADFWGGAASYGVLWPAHFLQWIVALTAFRTLMTWVYDRAKSLLFGVLMHAGFTGSQLFLWPRAAPAQELVWYGLFAFILCLAAAVVLRAPSLRPRRL